MGQIHPRIWRVTHSKNHCSQLIIVTWRIINKWERKLMFRPKSKMLLLKVKIQTFIHIQILHNPKILKINKRLMTSSISSLKIHRRNNKTILMILKPKLIMKVLLLLEKSETHCKSRGNQSKMKTMRWRYWSHDPIIILKLRPANSLACQEWISIISDMPSSWTKDSTKITSRWGNKVTVIHQMRKSIGTRKVWRVEFRVHLHSLFVAPLMLLWTIWWATLDLTREIWTRTADELIFYVNFILKESGI